MKSLTTSWMKIKTDLYDYQQKAVDKLLKIKIGALYMEMGTGKTRTALEFAIRRLQKGRIDHVIWLCPFAIKESIKRNLLEHIDDISFTTIAGIESLSSSIKENVKLLRLVKSKRCFLIVDESNLVKNFFAKRTKAIIRLAEYCPYRMILNGTPISRDEADLFAQWYILDWRVLGYKSYWSFSANHLEFDENRPGRHVRVLNTEYLMRKIAPYSYQIRKEDCLELPPKTYGNAWFELTQEQKQHYWEVFDLMLGQLDELEPITIYRLLSSLQAVVSGNYLEFEFNIQSAMPTKSSDITYKRRRFYNNFEDDPRAQTLFYLIEKTDEKVIIYARYRDEIDLITEHLNKNYGKAVKFYGEMSLKEREQSLVAFEKDAQFLVANKQTAGYGLNLQFCSYVIYYSNDWDLATRQQSEDRVHRIGQKENVHIIDIAASNTIDERILQNLSKKTDLVDDLKQELDRLKDKEELKVKLEEYLHNSKAERSEMYRRETKRKRRKQQKRHQAFGNF